MRLPGGRRALLVLVVGLLVVTAGCSGGADLGAGDGEPVAADESLEGDAAATEAPAVDDAGEAAVQPDRRAVVLTGEVSVRVEDFDAAERNLTRTAERYGGFVSDSRVDVERVGNETFKRGVLVLRVPSENFSAVVTAAEGVGELRDSSTESTDVTDQLVDIDARLANLRAERDRLRELYREANDTEDVLAVEERLSEVQGEIERLEARKAALQRQVALSTVRVELAEPRPAPGPVDTTEWYDTPVLAAFLESVNGVAVTLRALVVATAYAAPYLLVFGVPLAAAGYGIRRRRGRLLPVRDGGDGGDDVGEEDWESGPPDDGESDEADGGEAAEPDGPDDSDG